MWSVRLVSRCPRLGLRVAIQVVALELVNVTARLDDVSPQCGCFQPYSPCPPAGGVVAFQPRQALRHVLQEIAQCADQPHGLGIVAFIQ
jgi:hypothetical protein